MIKVFLTIFFFFFLINWSPFLSSFYQEEVHLGDDEMMNIYFLYFYFIFTFFFYNLVIN